MIDYEWLISNFHNDAYRLEKPRFNSARVVSGADMPIEGFVDLSLSINNHTCNEVPFNVVQGLSQTFILGLQFLNKYGATINCAERTLTLDKISQLRVIEKQEIPAHSQSIIRAKLSNKIPVNVIGVGQCGRHVTALGIMVANTTSIVLENNCVNILVMSSTDETITLYPRTNLGTFTVINPDLIQPFDVDNNVVDLVTSTERNNSVESDLKSLVI